MSINWEIFIAVVTVILAVSAIIGFFWTVHRDSEKNAQRSEDKYNKDREISDQRWLALLERWHIHDKKLEELTYKNTKIWEK